MVPFVWTSTLKTMLKTYSLEVKWLEPTLAGAWEDHIEVSIHDSVELLTGGSTFHLGDLLITQ